MTMNIQINRSCWAFACLGIALLFAGCKYPNQFRNVSVSSPHAVIVGSHVSVGGINGQPTSFWRCRERFRIPPGHTTVHVVTGVWDFPDYPPLEFTAIPGCGYTLTHQASNGCHTVFVSERPRADADNRVVAQVEAERKKSK